jgi:hypothetical protein
MNQKSQDGAAKQNVPKPELAPSVQNLEAEGQLARAAAALRRVTSAPAEPLSPADIIALQRTVGNQVVQRTLAVGSPGRDGVHRGRGLITPRVSAAVQRAGTGIAKGDTVDDFAEGARGVQSEWEKLSASERANKLGALANAALATIKVPPVTILMADLGKGSGAFNSATWTLKINTTIISKDSITEAELADLSNTFYHEARHAEQYFRVARWVAGLGKPASYIAPRLGIPGRIAIAAVDKPLKPAGLLDELLGDGKERAQEIAEAKEWAASLGPIGQKRYSKVVKELDAADKALEEALAAYRASPTEENKEKAKKARDVFKKKYRAYRSFADEKDAFKVGAGAEEAFKSAGSQGSEND